MKDNFEKQKAEALQLVFICANDIVNSWPNVTLRTLWTMTDKIDTLKQAIVEYRKFL